MSLLPTNKRLNPVGFAFAGVVLPLAIKLAVFSEPREKPIRSILNPACNLELNEYPRLIRTFVAKILDLGTAKVSVLLSSDARSEGADRKLISDPK